MDLAESAEKRPGDGGNGCVAAAAAAAATLLLAVLLAWTQPGFFHRDDNAMAFHPYYTHNIRVLVESGQPALVNWFQYGGIPHLAHGQQGTLYPPVYAAYGLAALAGLPSTSAIDLLAVIHLAAAAAAVAWLARTGGLSGPASIACGLLWSTSPFVFSLSRSWIFVAYAACWAPVCLALLLRCLERPGLRSWGLLAAAKALFFLQGYAQYAFYYFCLEGALLLLLALREPAFRRLRWWAGYAGHGVVAAGLAAPLMLPLAQAVARSQERTALTLAQKLQFSLHPASWGKANLLDFEPVLFHLDSRIYFVAPLLVLAIWALVAAQRTRPAHRAPAPALGAACLHGALGAWTLATPACVLLAWLPVFGWFRWPLKFYFFVPLMLVIAVALLGRRAEARRPRLMQAALWLAAATQLAVSLHREEGALISGQRAASGPVWPGMTWEEGRVATAGFMHAHERFDQTLHAHAATLHGVFAYWGYDPLVPRSAGLGKPPDHFARMWPWPVPEAAHASANAWGVLRVVTPASAPASPGWTLESEWNGLRLWRNERALPLARWEDGAAAGRLRVRGNALMIRWADPLPQDRRLCLAVSPMSGLSIAAEPSGRGIPWQEDQGMLEVQVPAGSTGFKVSVMPPLFLVGSLGAALALPLLVWMLASPARESHLTSNS